MEKIYKCPNCNEEYDNLISLCKHWSRSHKLETKFLYLKLNNLEKEPTCACGCGEQVKFLDAGRGFSEYVRGHAARVNNNFHKNPETFQKSLQTRKKMIVDGSFKPFALKETGKSWHKGLTKETDERVAKMANAIKNNIEEIQTRSKRMKQGRLDGTIPTQYGKDHPQWADGVSSLNHTCRTNHKLYNDWVKPILKKFNFACFECDSKIELHVHHNNESFSTIIRKIAKQFNWPIKMVERINNEINSDDLQILKQKISDAVAQYHIDNNVSGIVLCRTCHKNLHNKHNL